MIHYSGHGNHIENNSKLNNFNETIVPYDYNNQIKDDEIKLLLYKAKSANLTLVFDCCHSGDITREGSIAGADKKPVVP